jgi:hypothetical protein
VLGELERRIWLAEIATPHLQRADRELDRLQDVLERQRRRRSGLGTAATVVLALAAWGGGLGLGAW